MAIPFLSDISAAGNLYLGEYLYHNGNTGTNIRFQTNRQTLTSGGGAIVDLHSNGQLYFTGLSTFYNDITISKADPKLTFYDTTVNTDPSGQIVFSESSGVANFDINYNGSSDRLEFRGRIGNTDHTDLVYINRDLSNALQVVGVLNVGTFTSTGTSTLNLISEAEHNTKLGFFEDNLNHGFSLNYHGDVNDFIIKRHNASGTGDDVITLFRENNHAKFEGNLAIGGLDVDSAKGLRIKSQSISTQSSAIEVMDSSNTNPIIRMGEKSTDGGRLHLFDGGSEKIAFYTDNTDNHISAGNLGIGLSNPSNKLHVASGTADTVARFTSSNNLAKIIVEDDDTQAIIGASDNIAYFGPQGGDTAQENIRLDGRAGRGNGGYAAYGQTPNEAYKFRVSAGALNTSTDANYTALSARIEGTGTASLTSDRYLRGLHIDVDSDATGGNTSDEFRIYGGEFNVKDTGDADLLYGIYAFAENEKTSALDNVTTVAGVRAQSNIDNTAGTVTNSHGVYGTVRAAGSGTKISMYGGRFELSSGTSDADITNVYGSYGKIIPNTGYTGTIATARGAYGEVEISTGNTITNSWGVQSVIDHNGGTATTAAQFRGSTSGTIGTSYGIYSTGAAVNRLDGKLSVNTTATPTHDLTVGGDIKLTGNAIFDDGTIVSDGTNFGFDGAGGREVYISSARDVRIIIDDNDDDTGTDFNIYKHSATSGNELLTINQSGLATFEGKVRANNWFQGADGTNTLYSNATAGTLIQTPGSTADNNDSKIYFRNHGTTVKHTFDTNSGTATFVGDTFTPGLYVNATSAVAGTQVAIVKDGDQNLQRWGSTSNGSSQHSYRFRIDQNFKFIGNSGGGDKITIHSNTGDIDTSGSISSGDITSTHTGGGTINLRRDDTSTETDNILGAIYFQSDDPTNSTFNTGPYIEAKAGANWDTNSYPGYLVFNTRNTSGGHTAALTLNKDASATFAGDVDATSYKISGTTRIDSNGKFFPASINGTGKISFLNGSSAQGARVSSLYAGTTYANDGSAAGTVDTLNGYRVQGTTVIDSSRNLTVVDLTVTGDLTVEGNNTILETQTVEVEDNILQLNTTQGSPNTATAATSGISVYRGDGVTQASFIFDESDDTWDLTNNLSLAGQLTSGRILATAPQTGIHQLINASVNSTVLQLITTGDNPDLALSFQTDHIFNTGASLHIQNDNQKIFLRGSQTTVGTTTAQSGYELTVSDGPGKSIHTSGTITTLGGVEFNTGLIKYEQNTDVDSAAAEAVASVVKATHTAAFFDYVIKKGTNVRAGVVTACHDGTNVEYAETSTVDLGDTSDVTLSVDISGTLMRLIATTTSNDWSVKSLIRAI